MTSADPPEGFESLDQAQQWVLEFVQWYNHEHRHSAVRYVTPQQRHEGQEVAILEQRARLYEQAKARNPERWSQNTRNWEPVGAVWLNPEPVLEAA
ncbi:transposase [Halospina sp. K52047b]|nr:transposase [Halospina sp. K52047b]